MIQIITKYLVNGKSITETITTKEKRSPKGKKQVREIIKDSDLIKTERKILIKKQEVKVDFD
jgi:hypothetical protein